MKRTIALECPSCAFATKEGEALSWKQDTGSTYLLDFEVGSSEDTLDIEGVQLYPPTFGYFAAPFYATQLDPGVEDALRLQVTGYTFHFNSAETVTEAGIELLPVTFKITSIEGRPVNPPALTINLLKDTNGRLMIASFKTTQAGEAGSVGSEDECKNWSMLCQWRSYLSNSINGLKSSVGKACHKHKSNPMAEDGVADRPPHRFRPGHPHHHPHNGPHHISDNYERPHHHHHSTHMFLRRAFFTVLIPILIGIFAGTLTYLIGMALGYVIAIVVAKVRGRAPYERIALGDEEEVEYSNEKEAFIAELPEYEAPAVYEHVPEKEVVPEKEAVEDQTDETSK